MKDKENNTFFLLRYILALAKVAVGYGFFKLHIKHAASYMNEDPSAVNYTTALYYKSMYSLPILIIYNL